MANKDFKDFSSLFKEIEKNTASVLKNEIARKSIEKMQEHLIDDVYSYDAVHPENRRMYNDGLIDPRNIEITVINDNTISIENIAYDGDRNVPYIVESGEGYFQGASPELTKGRKFTENTYEELKSTGVLNSVMAAGLRKRGLDVR